MRLVASAIAGWQMLKTGGQPLNPLKTENINPSLALATDWPLGMGWWMVWHRVPTSDSWLLAILVSIFYWLGIQLRHCTSWMGPWNSLCHLDMVLYTTSRWQRLFHCPICTSVPKRWWMVCYLAVNPQAYVNSVSSAPDWSRK